MSKIDRVFNKIGTKVAEVIDAIEDFDYRYILLAAIFGLGVLVGLAGASMF